MNHGVERACASPEELADQDDLDIIYIATPHDSHRPLAELALRSGKHVLIEKPLATTAADAQAILDLASSLGLLAMEAMWTRYLPQADILRQLLESQAIGEVNFAQADFGFVASYDPLHRLFNPARGGGALLDAGVYPVSFLVSVLGVPDSIQSTGTLAGTGVDDHVHLTLGTTASLGSATTSLRSALPARAMVSGTHGRIEIEPAYIRPSTISLSTKGTWGPDNDARRWTDDQFAEPYDALHYQALAAARYAGEGRVESPLHDHQETVAVIRVLEQARKQIGAA